MSDMEFNNKELTFEDKIQHARTTVEKKWIYSYPYTASSAIEFKSMPFPSILNNNPMFQIHIAYLMTMFYSVLFNKNILGNSQVEKEIRYWDSEGGLCIYMSVVLHTLLLEDKICNKNDLRLIQGYNNYISTNPIMKLFGGNHETNILNFHSWLSYKNHVLDLSIKQEGDFLDIGQKEFIMGDIPSGLAYVGWKESHQTVQNYMKKFAEHLNLEVNDWITMHRLTSVETALQYLKKE